MGGHPEGKEFLSDLSSLHTGVFETKLQVICLSSTSCASGLGYIVLNYRVGHSHGQYFLCASAICIPWPALISMLRHYLIVAIIGPCFAYVSHSCHLLLLLKSFVFSLLFMCLCLLYVCVGVGQRTAYESWVFASDTQVPGIEFRLLGPWYQCLYL